MAKKTLTGKDMGLYLKQSLQLKPDQQLLTSSDAVCPSRLKLEINIADEQN